MTFPRLQDFSEKKRIEIDDNGLCKTVSYRPSLKNIFANKLKYKILKGGTIPVLRHNISLILDIICSRIWALSKYFAIER